MKRNTQKALCKSINCNPNSIPLHQHRFYIIMKLLENLFKMASGTLVEEMR